MSDQEVYIMSFFRLRPEVLLRPVYTGDFCRGNSMQFLLRESCNFKIYTCKPGAIFSAICRRDIAGVSNMFET